MKFRVGLFKKIQILGVIGSLGIGVPGPLWSAEDEKTELVGVKTKGVFFNVASDRRVENIGGVYQPEGLDIYLKRNLDTMSEEIRDLRKDVQDLAKGIEAIKVTLEEDKKKPAQSGPAPKPKA
ncbi:MAG: hypothetical protein ACOY3K_02260 [Candidatus Omnitrophota bacterium]